MKQTRLNFWRFITKMSNKGINVKEDEIQEFITFFKIWKSIKGK
jgi:hypothetical protein